MRWAHGACILLARFCAIMASVGITLIVLFVVVAMILAASIVLGRDAREVESARDTEYLELEGVWIRYDVIGGGAAGGLLHRWVFSFPLLGATPTPLGPPLTPYNPHP